MGRWMDALRPISACMGGGDKEVDLSRRRNRFYDARLEVAALLTGASFAPTNGLIYFVPLYADKIGVLPLGNTQPAYEVDGGVPEGGMEIFVIFSHKQVLRILKAFSNRSVGTSHGDPCYSSKALLVMDDCVPISAKPALRITRPRPRRQWISPTSGRRCGAPSSSS